MFRLCHIFSTQIYARVIYRQQQDWYRWTSQWWTHALDQVRWAHAMPIGTTEWPNIQWMHPNMDQPKNDLFYFVLIVFHRCIPVNRQYNRQMHDLCAWAQFQTTKTPERIDRHNSRPLFGPMFSTSWSLVNICPRPCLPCACTDRRMHRPTPTTTKSSTETDIWRMWPRHNCPLLCEENSIFFYQ